MKKVESRFRLMLEEVAFRSADQDLRYGATQNLAGILIGSASITSAFFLDLSNTPALQAVGFSIVAAGLGVASIFPRPIDTIEPRNIRDRVLSDDDVASHLYVLDQRIIRAERREGTIRIRMRLIRFGFIALGVSLMLAFAGAVGASVGTT